MNAIERLFNYIETYHPIKGDALRSLLDAARGDYYDLCYALQCFIDTAAFINAPAHCPRCGLLLYGHNVNEPYVCQCGEVFNASPAE